MDPGPNPPVVRGSEQRDAAFALAIEHRRSVGWVAVLPGTLLLMVAGATGGWVNKAQRANPPPAAPVAVQPSAAIAVGHLGDKPVKVPHPMAGRQTCNSDPAGLPAAATPPR